MFHAPSKGTASQSNLEIDYAIFVIKDTYGEDVSVAGGFNGYLAKVIST